MKFIVRMKIRNMEIHSILMSEYVTICVILFFICWEARKIKRLWLKRKITTVLRILSRYLCYQNKKNTHIDDNNDKIFVQIIIFACFVWHVCSHRTYTFCRSLADNKPKNCACERRSQTQPNCLVNVPGAFFFIGATATQHRDKDSKMIHIDFGYEICATYKTTIKIEEARKKNKQRINGRMKKKLNFSKDTNKSESEKTKERKKKISPLRCNAMSLWEQV